MARKFLSGNEAFAEGIRLARPQVRIPDYSADDCG